MLQSAERFRLRLNNGEAQWGTFLVEFEATGAVRMLANAGLDFILIDGEHGAYDISQMRRLIEASTAAGLPHCHEFLWVSAAPSHRCLTVVLMEFCFRKSERCNKFEMPSL